VACAVLDVTCDGVIVDQVGACAFGLGVLGSETRNSPGRVTSWRWAEAITTAWQRIQAIPQAP